jgi:hypothetical protein
MYGWWLLVNGESANWGYTTQTVTDGDVIKWGDTGCSPSEEFWVYYWTTPVTPVSNPNATEVVDATIAADQIEYWVGEGENEVVIAITWCSNTEAALAWGYRFDGETNLLAALNAIAEADSRLTVYGSAPTNITYQDDVYDLTMQPNPEAEWGDDDYDIPMFSVNGAMGQVGMSAQAIHNNDFAKIGGYACATMNANWTVITWDIPIEPATIPGEVDTTGTDTTVVEEVDATISANEIAYWVGEGENEVVVAISWCSNTEAALAWGYRFHGEATVFEALTAIAAADSRLAVVGSAPSNVTYQDGELDLTMQPNPNAQWGDPDYDAPMHSINGLMGQNYMAAESIHDGDFVKIGGSACGIFFDDWSSISWTTTIVPATAPAEVGPSDETFDGVAGSEGCQGIHCQDPAILGWASTCTIERGRQNITTPGVFASYGTENDGVGAATESTADVVSLGDYGIAVLTFDIPIQNGDGYDFAVFENGLNNTFLELAFVEVSSDGVNYFRFSSVSNTPTDVQIDNNGGVDAIHLNNLAGKYRAGWGTPFDLEELAGTEGLDVNNITHIRLVDVVGCVEPRYATRDGRGHIINDPYPTPFASSGFDLDGVAVMNGWRPAAVQEYVENSHLNVYPNPCNTQVTVEAVIGEPVMLFNSVGTLVYRTNANDTTMTLNMSDYPAGLYIVKCGNRTARIVKM